MVKKTSKKKPDLLQTQYWQDLKAPPWEWGLDESFKSLLHIQIRPSRTELKKELKNHLNDWQLNELINSEDQSLFSFSGKKGPVWILLAYNLDKKNNKKSSLLSDGDMALLRNALGSWYRQELQSSQKVNVYLSGGEKELYQTLYAFLLADYSPSKTLKSWSGPKIKMAFKAKIKSTSFKKLIQKALVESSGHNLSRHLTNLPPNLLNPKNFSELAKQLFQNNKNVKVEVWDSQRLYKENCHLLNNVGKGSEFGSYLVHISYRPKATPKKTLAFVGKGVTFDTGGLDIKPSVNMRLMKKDMSGAGVVLGLAYFSANSSVKKPLDFYLAITENAISEKSTRPSDVHHSRSGQTVEIHNTDAEGRLAMADALTLAAEKTGAFAPESIIDVSTLTGTMRVSLGLDVAGYFSNDDSLSKKLEAAAKQSGELIWRQPLVSKYKALFDSKIADMTNCSETPFGGAITAALFLENFVKNKSWAHFDVMAWNLSPYGALSEGGNGQSYLTLAHLIQS